MTLSLIAAMAANRVIGRENQLPWRLPADLKRFKRLTMGHCLIMGRRTFESIGRPLPGRTTIVLTGDRCYRADGALVAHSLEQALEMSSGDQVFVCGGESVYRQTIGRADRLYLTLLHRDFAGDACFPEIAWSEWRIESRERHEASEEIPFAFEFLDCARELEGRLNRTRRARAHSERR